MMRTELMYCCDDEPWRQRVAEQMLPNHY